MKGNLGWKTEALTVNHILFYHLPTTLPIISSGVRWESHIFPIFSPCPFNSLSSVWIRLPWAAILSAAALASLFNVGLMINGADSWILRYLLCSSKPASRKPAKHNHGTNTIDTDVFRCSYFKLSCISNRVKNHHPLCVCLIGILLACLLYSWIILIDSLISIDEWIYWFIGWRLFCWFIYNT